MIITNRLYHVVSTNVNKTNQVNDAADNYLKFDIINSLVDYYVKDILPTVTIHIRGGKSLDIPWSQV